MAEPAREITLELADYPVRAVAFAGRTCYQEGTLYIDVDGLKQLVSEDKRLAGVSFHLAFPGESVRIIHAWDVIEPRFKSSGPSGVFPGMLHDIATVGSGRTHRLDGMAVVTTGLHREAAFDTVVSVAEGIIDMQGVGADYTPFSHLIHLVLECTPAPGIRDVSFSEAMRLAGLRVAEQLARTTTGLTPVRLRTYRLASREEMNRLDLPGVVLVSQLARTGDLYDTFLYGRSVEGLMPTVLHPNEFFDGAVVSGNYRYACQRNPTYVLQNHPILEQLYERHGRELWLRGAVVNRGHNNFLADKERTASQSAKLARLLGADGVIITAEGGGHALADVMMTCQACEQAGMASTVISAEMAGPDGADNPFVDYVSEADCLVSVGNQEALISLPPVERVIGGNRLLESGEVAQGRLHIPVRYLYCSTNQLGFGRVQAVAF